jgi:hypothetical protein
MKTIVFVLILSCIPVAAQANVIGKSASLMGPVIACQNKYDLETLVLAEAERVAAIPSSPDPEMEHYPNAGDPAAALVAAANPATTRVGNSYPFSSQVCIAYATGHLIGSHLSRC